MYGRNCVLLDSRRIAHNVNSRLFAVTIKQMETFHPREILKIEFSSWEERSKIPESLKIKICFLPSQNFHSNKFIFILQLLLFAKKLCAAKLHLLTSYTFSATSFSLSRRKKEKKVLRFVKKLKIHAHPFSDIPSRVLMAPTNSHFGI